MNINVNTTQDELKYKLEELVGINSVLVSYSDVDDRQYSGGSRICTSVGNTVTMTFVNVSFPQYNGNVPTFQYDRYNQYSNLLSGQNMGTGLLLTGRNAGYNPSVIGSVVNEGFQKTDGIATYLSGSGTSSVTF